MMRSAKRILLGSGALERCCIEVYQGHCCRIQGDLCYHWTLLCLLRPGIWAPLVGESHEWSRRRAIHSVPSL